MPVFTSSIEVTADYPTIKPSLNLNFARSRSLDPRITFTRASTATYVGRNGLIKTAGVDEARFDHDPETLESLGLLIEESRTNLISYSQDFTNVVWQSANNRATCDATTGIDDPSGGTTASRWSSGTSPAQELIYRQTGTTAGELTGLTCTKSIWVRRVSNDGVISFFVGDNIGTSINSQLNSVPVGTWVRCSLTRTIVGNNGDTRNYIAVYPGTDGQPTTIDIWGDQFEVGSFPTSYIPTAGSSVTRASDYATILGDSFDSFFNPYESTLYASVVSNGTNNGGIVGIDRSDGTTYIDPIYTGSTITFYGSGGPDNKPRSGDGRDKLIQTWNDTGDTQSFTANGATPSSYTFTSSIAPDKLSIGRYSFAGGNFFNGIVSEVRYYTKALTDAQLQLLTS